MNNTTNSWEEKFKEFARTMEVPYEEMSVWYDFIATLIHDTEIAAREEEKDGCYNECQNAYDEGKKVAREEIKKEIENIKVATEQEKALQSHIISTLTKE